MNPSFPGNGLRVTHSGDGEPGDGTLRIEYDRRRLLLAAVASGVAVLTTSAALVLALVHLGRRTVLPWQAPGLDPALTQFVNLVPWWAPLALGIAAVVAVIRMLRNVFRLQDADPAFVISPRDLRFKPGVFGESVRIPWTSIRGIRTRRYRKHRSIVLQIEDVARYVPRAAWFGSARRRSNEIALPVPLSRAALDELASLLQTHLARHGRPALPHDAARAPATESPARPRAGTTTG